ncbi:SNF2 family N-terminal domain-containing protein [Halteromyces radiatus]|uniref:SNF2 family N-terminal domain-containing protein n=1 Tax=Halteromyces radiatus TaxID=101107 RepID=UPI00221E954F|nr:SNF2 family N-terminal domain-containing protein [Halteromyces radiatus]KAI8093622.1 SNF2 family N-terminal domain-containing protein [Halteromyces radiatus]
MASSSSNQSPTINSPNAAALNAIQYQMLAYNLLSKAPTTPSTMGQSPTSSQNVANATSAPTPIPPQTSTLSVSPNNNNNISSSTTHSPVVKDSSSQATQKSATVESTSSMNNQELEGDKPLEQPVPHEEEEEPKSLMETLVETIYKQAKEYKATMDAMKTMTTSNTMTQMDDQLTPQNLLYGQQRSHAHASRQQRLLLPKTIPIQLDPYTILLEREKFIPNRIRQKMEALEAITVDNMAQQSQSLGYMLSEYYTETVRMATSDQLKSIIQLKALQLREKQAKLREEVVLGMEEANRLANSVDRTSYRKLMKRTLREAKQTEKLERQHRLYREKRQKQKYLDYLQKVCNQGRDMLTWHKTHQAKMSKLGKAVLQFHAYVDREEQKRNDKRSKERIRALRNDDEEAYMKLIDEAKDTRLTMLLRQTGTYLESLSRAVADQKNDPVHEQQVSDLMDDENMDEEALLMDKAGSQSDYFRMAHKVQESVRQPNIMVGGKLKEYQIKGLQWMVSLYNNRLNGILADEMGLGKTIQTISLVTYLIEKKQQNGPYLIIVPLSTLTNWSLEFEKWAPTVNTVVYKGPPDVRKQIQRNQLKHQNFQVLLTTFDYIIKDRPVLSKFKWLHMVIDEGHRLKNTQSKLTTVIRQNYSSRYRLILTGTPLQNNLPELWALLNFILPKIFNSVKSFEEWFNTPFSNQGVQDRVELNEEEQLLIIKRLHKVLRPFLLRRLKKDVESELPDKVEHVIKCKLSALQSKLYIQMKKHGVLFTGSNEKTGRTTVMGLNNRIMQLRKICNHPFVFEKVEQQINPFKMSNELLYRSSGKFELLDRILPKLKATGHRVLIFFQMTQIMDIMEDYCIYRGLKHMRLDGSTKADTRSQQLKDFNAEDSPYFVFLLSTRAGGLGLNLQTADTVIIFDSDWNPHQDLQAQDRAHRIGQTKEVRIFRLITENSIEESILARAQYKLDIDGKVIQAGKFDNRSTEEDREAFLRSLLEDKSDEQQQQQEGDDNNEEQEEFDDDELNDILKRSDEEGVLFSEMDKERQQLDREWWQQLYGKDINKTPERLLQDWELPDVYHQEMSMLNDLDNESSLGRGQQRSAKHGQDGAALRYDDGMTEGQWLRHIERMEDDAAKVSKRKKQVHGEDQVDDNAGSLLVKVKKARLMTD